MSKTIVSVTGALILAATLSGCLSSEPVDPAGIEVESTGVSATGARWLRPGTAAGYPIEARDVPDPRGETWPPLDRDAVAGLRRWMTETELVRLLGEPRYEEVIATDIDTGGRDWNARVLQWRFEDRDFLPAAVTRDLEVRLGRAPRVRPLPERPEVSNGEWVVIRWSLD